MESKRSIVCTFGIGNYHHGVAALINSLCQSGFKGIICVALEGDTDPNWCRSFNRDDSGHYQITPEIQLSLEKIDLDRRITYLKGRWMIELVERYSEASEIFYFDSDIVVTAPWKEYLLWVKDSVALCEDLQSPWYSNDPRRRKWREFFSNFEISLPIDSDIYVNGGFVGVSRANIKFLRDWENLIEKIGKEMDSPLDIYEEDPYTTFRYSDQDLLNCVLMHSSYPISIISKGGMGFGAGISYMIHIIDRIKPWQGGYLWRVLFKGWRMSHGMVVYHRFLRGGPCRSFNVFKLLSLRIDLFLAKLASKLF